MNFYLRSFIFSSLRDKMLQSYAVLLHTYSTTCNPTVHVFLWLLYKDKSQEEKNEFPKKVSLSKIELDNLETELRKKRARTRWFLAITLHRNPTLQGSRKTKFQNWKDSPVKQRFNQLSPEEQLKRLRSQVSALELSISVSKTSVGELSTSSEEQRKSKGLSQPKDDMSQKINNKVLQTTYIWFKDSERGQNSLSVLIRFRALYTPETM